MKKLVSIVALLAVMLIASSGYNGTQPIISIGDAAPSLSVNNQTSAFDLDGYKGEYVLLTFWSSADAKSRAECNAYSSWFRKHDCENLKHIAINFDSQNALFEEVVRLDNFDEKAQYHVSGLEAAQIRLNFGLNEGYGSILISPDGFVTSFNPSTSELSSLI